MHKIIDLMVMFLILLAISSPSQAVWNEEELLVPDQAFQISGRTDGVEKLRVEWRIADGYYMYRDKIHFDSDTIGIEIGEPTLSEAKIKNDEFFGEVAVYRNKAIAEIPIRRMQGSQETLLLKARSQGCADLGICFPPHIQEIRLALEPVPAEARTQAIMEPLLAVTDRAPDPLFDNNVEDELLDPEEAYKLSVSVEDGTHIRLYWSIADGTYLYQDNVALSIPESETVALGEISLPEAEIKQDSVKPDGTIGDIAVYHNEIDLIVPLVRSNTEADEFTLEARYQGCAEIGVCYPPITKQFTLALPAISAAQASEIPDTTVAAPASPASEPVSELDQITNTLKGGSTLLIIGAFFLLGLGLSFTPCIFPMIPILSGIIAGHGDKITTQKAFTLSLVYVLAMAITYTVAGVLAGLFGGNLQAYFQDPWILSAFALVFVLLALSMFGFYDLQLPSSLQSRLSEASNKQQGGTLSGVAIMGFLSALIVGPCVAPPLAGALIYIGQTGDAMLGGLALFALSMGMGAPLIAIGTSAGKLLPRAGSWMDAVKAVFGVALLGVAIIMLERIIPAELAMLLWGILFIVSAIYMGALRNLEIEASGWQKLWKGLGFVFLVYGTLMLVGAASGGKDTLQPLRGIAIVGGSGATAGHQELQFKRIKSIDDLQREVAFASSQGRPVMLDFYADWCVSCKEMEKYTFSDTQVIDTLSNTHLLQADVTANDDVDQALLQGHFGLPGPPAIIFYGSDGQERRNYRLVGFMPAAEFSQHAARAIQ
ncbi:MAG: thiol:disulfide interchange protein [gamma proteobacterium symbiont of Ctena orbiculata]|uniref:Thiol:disulfide interchange protein DsbD n=1 Tax=Candidatus Thiodiazotropha taylori TaxID=2792791 RepID=A0A944QT30_9GAMM|nr:protein-disulfide reductase DsbD [Candidatus Thiodiazotropha taylori]PUB84531.1 MAG: thiol:disulfide interchange protein [gamma proteobacterium symbiont of Ctena orbiculata]MBT2987529.1 protein-disulfide reductase DsbD [Candidatus Thiodiazotropha taylori]MBT2995215.1 protein-disulfide reductase DsbD [Candidatus Thiodiazotropha taylori]MBT2999866.1 protein-disulfide reductase DsbD [Candidatus Thiodiazotropha taylori]